MALEVYNFFLNFTKLVGDIKLTLGAKPRS